MLSVYNYYTRRNNRKKNDKSDKDLKEKES